MSAPLRVDAYTLALRDLRALTTDTRRYLAVAAKLADAQAAAGQPRIAGPCPTAAASSRHPR
jgi:hypothetical protein